MTHLPSAPIVLDSTGADRHAENVLLRSHGAAVPVDVLGVRAWSVSDPDVLKKLLNSPDVSKDARRHWPQFAEVVQTWPLALWVAVENMFTAYGADHRRLRRMISPAFTARRTAGLSEVVDTVVTTLLDALDALPADESVDLREYFAHPLPIAVIGRLMGIPDHQRTDFREVVDGVFDTTLTTEQANANTVALYTVLDRLIADKRREPGEDMTSLLIATRDEDGSTLSVAELRDTLLLVISAGYQTTVDTIDQGIVLLATHRDQLAHIRAGRATWADAVEETLRLEPAVAHLPLRYAVNDLTLPDGRVIARGEAILASYAAANRHPRWHGESADVFDVTRLSKEHLAFGHGVHYCLGAPLARMEAAAALRGLFDRFPDLELVTPADELEPAGSLISNGHKTLHVRLRPSGT
ncbi:cytochrome P450 [Streptomyces sp. NPDC001744]|uniref:cytochrome P450 family protein n=1 Tax=Streptomyces sp. NPDC001744 TaxID=3364606 RepID=UPI00367DC0B5